MPSLSSAWSVCSVFISDTLGFDADMAACSLLLVLFVAGCGLAAQPWAPNRWGHAPLDLTDRPIIGILSMELSPTIQKYCGAHDSYIAASYVKFVEGAGAQVAPILIGQSPEYYKRMANSVNGLLLPGGATLFVEENGIENPLGYAAAGRQLYAQAKAINARGEYFPVLGICLGMELLAFLDAKKDILSTCNSEEPLPLKFLPGCSKGGSRMFSRAPRRIVATLESNNVTVNHHKKCLTRSEMQRSGLDREWRTLTVSKDAAGHEFVSAFEHTSQPYYGVQFHPEKNIYEWKRNKHYPHSAAAIAASRFFADFLVSEARRNNHSFPASTERDELIYRHQPVDTKEKLMWEQLYFFEKQTNLSTSPIVSTTENDSQHDFDVGMAWGESTSMNRKLVVRINTFGILNALQTQV
ncbi:Gamma-glutamyl hydrolase A [Frankliniella fusca]|uniref:folate gamma-glutamyl hydrolase n=1 Tax=Frankliniella fusca TaxID=407009 RepID=A0AAE1I191_9NEOP|nr:Gamma-glutamyl hydrolase A [Frankliniella fusca]